MTWVVSLIGFGSLIGLMRWRNAVLFLLLVGFLQDPIRKVVPGFPLYLQLLVFLFFGIVLLCALLQNVHLRLGYLHGRDERLREAWLIFIVLIVLQCVHTYVLHGNTILAGLGFVNYATPLLAIIVGIAFAKDDTWIRKFFLVYLLFAVPIGLTVYSSFYFQDEWNVLQSIGRLSGNPLLIFDQGTVLYSNSGLMRTGEIAAWHAGTAIMVLIMFATMERRPMIRVMVGVLVMLLIGAIVLTGRRKMIMAVAIFLAVFILMLMVYWRGRNKFGALIVILSVGAAVYSWLEPDKGESTLYAARGVSVFGEVEDRLYQAWSLIQAGYYRGGLFGLGAGVSAQGSQYFGGGARIVGGAAEAGGSKLVVELGMVGFVAVLYLVWRLLLHFHRFFRMVPAHYEYLSVSLAGLTGVVVSNMATFLIATQVFGDSFILILSGFFVSFLFALERLTRGL